MQWNDAVRSLRATMYYAPESGLGRVLAAHAVARARRIGVIGLGVGTLASYGRAADRLSFFELNPDVIDLAHRHFSFLARSAAELEIALGDGRLTLSRAPPRAFDVLVVDAFSSDAVPTHLLTVEAFSVYLRQLAPDGILAFNVSNRHLEVERVVAGSALEHGLELRIVDTPSDARRGYSRVRWALLSRRQPALDAALTGAETAELCGLPVRWTDHYGGLIEILR
jgi:spermidine synthase